MTAARLVTGVSRVAVQSAASESLIVRTHDGRTHDGGIALLAEGAEVHAVPLDQHHFVSAAASVVVKAGVAQVRD